MNDICDKLYSDESLSITARSISIEDILGFMNEKGKQAIRNFVEPYSNLPYDLERTYTDNRRYPNFYITAKDKSESDAIISEPTSETYSVATEGLTTKSTYYAFNNSQLSEYFDETIKNILFGPSETNEYIYRYWLASRYVFSDTDKASFGIRYVHNGNLGAASLINSIESADETEEYRFVCPIISVGDKATFIKVSEGKYKIDNYDEKSDKYEQEIGDTVNYDNTNVSSENMNLSYTAEADNTGYSLDQIFYNNKTLSWKYFGTDENGKIQLIASAPELYFNGEKSIINGVDELNNICNIYGKGKYAESARSLKVEDINRITGYDPKVAKSGPISSLAYGNRMTYSWNDSNKVRYTSENGSGDGDSDYTTFKYYDENLKSFLDLTNPITIESTYYNYKITSVDFNLR